MIIIIVSSLKRKIEKNHRNRFIIHGFILKNMRTFICIYSYIIIWYSGIPNAYSKTERKYKMPIENQSVVVQTYS